MSGQVYAVASGKGGVGKTTTVVNLGVALRSAGRSVALVDADLGMANLATVIDIDHETSLHDVLSNDATLEAALVEQADGFAVLPGTRSLSGFADARPHRLEEVVEALAERYEYVLVDSGAGLSYEDVLPLALADRVLVVTATDPASVGDARKTMELAELVETPVEGVLVTFADGDDPGAIADEYGVELLGAIPDDPAVRDAASAGAPLQLHAPDSPAAEAYTELAARIVEVTPGDGEGTAASADSDDSSEPFETDDGDSGAGTGPARAGSAQGESSADDDGSTPADDASAPDTNAGSDAGATAVDEPTDDAIGGGGEGGDDRPAPIDEFGPAAAEPPASETDAGPVEEEETGEDDPAAAEPAPDDPESGGFVSRITGLFK